MRSSNPQSVTSGNSHSDPCPSLALFAADSRQRELILSKRLQGRRNILCFQIRKFIENIGR